jgi:hypothetical protein
MQRDEIYETAAARMHAEKAEAQYSGEEVCNESSERLYQSLREKLNL